MFKLQSKTAPIGIMKGLDAEELSFVLNKGDVCVMFSDGVVPSRQDSRWLMQFLSELKEDSPRALCQSIMKDAKKRGVKDDMTVVCAVIN